MGLRDNHQFSRGSYSALYGINGSSKVFWFGGTTYGPTTDTCRNTPITTLPLPNGEYYLPTSYGAHRYLMTTSAYRYTYDVAPGGPFNTWMKEGESSTGVWPIPFNTHGCDTTNRPYKPDVPFWLVQEAKAKLFDQMKARDFDLTIFLAELPKSIDTVANLALSGASLIKKFQSTEQYVRWINYTKGNRIPPGWSAYRIIKEYSKAWLTFQYGIKPIVSDILGAAKRASKAISPHPFAITEVRMLDPTFVGPNPPPPLFVPIWIDRSTYKRGVNVRVAWRVTNPALYALDSFGLTNPFVVAWELTTLSFVIDWFAGIGNFLQSFTNPVGVSFDHGYVTSWLKSNYDIAYATDYGARGKLPRLTGQLHVMHREVYSDFPVPLPYLKIPVSVTKAVTTLALLGRR